jgi:hypothetical protein
MRNHIFPHAHLITFGLSWEEADLGKTLVGLCDEPVRAVHIFSCCSSVKRPKALQIVSPRRVNDKPDFPRGKSIFPQMFETEVGWCCKSPHQHKHSAEAAPWT